MDISDIEAIEFYKSPALGVSPVFWVKFRKDSASDYEGISYTNLIGSYEAELDPELFSNLCSYLEEASIWSMNDKYTAGMTCQSAETIKVRFSNGTKHSVEDYGNAGPPELKRLRDRIKCVVNEVRWKEVEPRYKPTEKEIKKAESKRKCECGSGKRYENCHGIVR